VVFVMGGGSLKGEDPSGWGHRGAEAAKGGNPTGAARSPGGAAQRSDETPLRLLINGRR